MRVPPVGIRLPDLDSRTAHGLTGGAQHATRDVHHLPGSALPVALDEREVGVRIERFVERIERARCLVGRALQRLGAACARGTQRDGGA
jgi:hypothetical protein